MYRRLQIQHVALASLLLLFIIVNGQPIDDTDAWWHLKVGEYIWTTATIPHSDIFSFSNTGHPWVTHEWLSEIIYYLAYSMESLQGLFLLNIGLLSMTYYFYFRLAQLRNGDNLTLSMAILLTTAIFTFFFWVFRPHIFSHLLFVVFLLVLEKYYRGRDYLWLLPPLSLFWVNAHGSFIMGPILIVVYLISGWWKLKFPAVKSRELNPAQKRRLVLVLALCIMVSLINPNTYEILLYPLETVNSSFITDQINEWAVPDFHEPYFIIFLVYVLGVFLLLVLSRRQHRLVDLLLLGMVSFMSFYAVRNIPLYLFVAGPLAGSYITTVLQKTETKTSLQLSWLNWLLLVSVAVAAFHFWPPMVDIEKHVNARHLPVGAVNFIKEEGITGRVFNDYNWGGYLLWRAYPEIKVMIDGRTDVYADKVFPDYLNITRLRPGAYQLLKKYDPDFLLIGRGTPLDTYISTNKEWRKVYEDKLAVVYTPVTK